jgi:hypothetical protein
MSFYDWRHRNTSMDRWIPFSIKKKVAVASQEKQDEDATSADDTEHSSGGGNRANNIGSVALKKPTRATHRKLGTRRAVRFGFDRFSGQF